MSKYQLKVQVGSSILDKGMTIDISLSKQVEHLDVSSIAYHIEKISDIINKYVEVEEKS